MAACAEAKLELAVEQVALQKMRALKHGWVCALWVEGRLHVYLAGGLEDDNRWIMEVMAGGKESERVRVAKEQLESQPMVVMKEQRFFYVDTAGLGPFDGVGKGKGKGDCGCCSEKQQPDVRCRRSAVVFLPFSVGRDVKECPCPGARSRLPPPRRSGRQTLLRRPQRLRPRPCRGACCQHARGASRGKGRQAVCRGRGREACRAVRGRGRRGRAGGRRRG